MAALDPSFASDIVRRGYAHWRRLCGDRAMPARADVKPGEVAPILGHLVLVDVLRDPLDFRYRLIGTVVETHNSAPYTGKCLSELPGKGPGSAIFENLRNVVDGAAPSAKSVPYVGPFRDYKHTESVALPLSDDGNTVNMIMIFADYLVGTAVKTA